MGKRYKKSKEQIKQEIKKATQMLERGIENLLSSEKWKEYLKKQAKFPKYSFNNTIMILLQCPHATYVANYRQWQKLGRYVKKGETAIKIWQPRFLKQENDDGELESVFAGFRLTSVFDISQTDGKPIDTGMPVLGGETDLYEKLKSVCPLPVHEAGQDVCGTAHGFYDRKEHSITILNSLPSVDKFSVLVHELAHSILHKGEEGRELDREVKELEAESVSFIVCNYFGIDSSDTSFPYLAGWSKGDTKKLKQIGERIQKTSQQIIEMLSKTEDVEEVA